MRGVRGEFALHPKALIKPIERLVDRGDQRADFAWNLAKRQAHIRFPVKSGHLWLNSTNPLLRMRYPGTIGLKTGSTDRAGHCLVAVVRRGGRVYGAVLLHSPDSGSQAKKLFNAAFRLRS